MFLKIIKLCTKFNIHRRAGTCLKWQPLRRFSKIIKTQGFEGSQGKERGGSQGSKGGKGEQAEEGREEEAIFPVKALLKAVEESGRHMTPKALLDLQSSG